MTMYRGEAANHGILNAYHLGTRLEEVKEGKATQLKAIQTFETDMREKPQSAASLSRRACLDAHEWVNLNEDSAILKRRASKEGD